MIPSLKRRNTLLPSCLAWHFRSDSAVRSAIDVPFKASLLVSPEAFHLSTSAPLQQQTQTISTFSRRTFAFFRRYHYHHHHCHHHYLYICPLKAVIKMAVTSNRRPQRGPPKGPANNRHRDAKKDVLTKTREVTMRDARPASAPSAAPLQLLVTGWRKSKAASNSDGGVSALTSFLERRAGISSKKNKAAKGITKTQPVRIRKVRFTPG
jgi:hypothetical protein